MCGVFGFAADPGGARLSRLQWAVAHRLMVELAIASEERGTDAAGYAALTARGELLWQRQPGPARNLFQGKDFGALRRRRVVMAIGHTRLATTGAPAVNGNNHPHLAGEWALVHNGFIPLHEQKARNLGLHLKSQCDSEILAQALERFGEDEGAETCLALGGNQSVLAINVSERALLAWTNGGMPLVAFRVDGVSAVWWASTEDIALKACRQLDLQAHIAEAEPDTVYRCDGRRIRERG